MSLYSFYMCHTSHIQKEYLALMAQSNSLGKYTLCRDTDKNPILQEFSFSFTRDSG